MTAEGRVTLGHDRRPTKGDRPGPGALRVERGGRAVPLPLEAVSFRARVVERVAEVEVRQTFSNAFDEPLEAIYLFPLPGGAAVTRFTLEVAGKVLEGVVEEREEARRVY